MIHRLNHVAIIPDGNRRWATLHGVPPLQGHTAGAQVMHKVVDYLAGRGIKYLTLWGFSTDNWKRSEQEVSDIFSLLAAWLDKDTPWAHKKGIRLRHLGRLHELPQGLRQAITRAVTLTQNNSGMTLNVAFNYGAKSEILDAVRQIIKQGIPVEKVDENLFSRYLYTNTIPDVDLLIRTGGEYRSSNFMLWQAVYAEYYFTSVLWPDFNEQELERALASYSRRERRFGE